MYTKKSEKESGIEIKIVNGKDIYYILKYILERKEIYEECFYDEIKESSKLDKAKVRTDKNIYDAEWNRTVYHPESKKQMTLWFLLGMYAWHSRHHVAHIIGLRDREGWW